MKINLLLLIAACCIAGCSTPISNEDGFAKVKDLAEYGLRVQVKGELKTENEICALAYFDNSKYKILQGYGDCSMDSITGIDKKENKIIGCYKRVFIKDDTIKLCLMPADTGLFKFPSIQILFSDNEGNYFVADTSFTLRIK